MAGGDRQALKHTVLVVSTKNPNQEERWWYLKKTEVVESSHKTDWFSVYSGTKFFKNRLYLLLSSPSCALPPPPHILVLQHLEFPILELPLFLLLMGTWANICIYHK